MSCNCSSDASVCKCDSGCECGDDCNCRSGCKYCGYNKSNMIDLHMGIAHMGVAPVKRFYEGSDSDMSNGAETVKTLTRPIITSENQNGSTCNIL